MVAATLAPWPEGTLELAMTGLSAGGLSRGARKSVRPRRHESSILSLSTDHVCGVVGTLPAAATVDFLRGRSLKAVRGGSGPLSSVVARRRRRPRAE